MQWNVFVGCGFDCKYCEKSFQLQMKRQLHRCRRCYEYVPHFHRERLKQSLPLTRGDDFIWACSSGDITFAKPEWITQVLRVIQEKPDRLFMLQTKNPIVFQKFKFPPNVALTITLETNRDKDYRRISKAPLPSKRVRDFAAVKHERKFVTIEPILDFDVKEMVAALKQIQPERVYLGYDSKGCRLPEPSLGKVLKLEAQLKKFTKVKRKLIRKAWWE
ncbi:MAG: DUF5131 family protein [Candidatus Bathyarchaeia archaeon]